MGEYDLALKNLVNPDKSRFLETIVGERVTRALRNEVGTNSLRYADALVELESGALLHVEFQTTNARNMGWRMLDYNAEILRQFGDKKRAHFPTLRQFLIYVGDDTNRDLGKIVINHLSLLYGSYDIRDLCDRGGALFESEFFRDWILGLLCMETRYKDFSQEQYDAQWRHVLDCIADLDDADLQEAYALLQITASRRPVSHNLKREIDNMPFNVDAAYESPILKQAIDHGKIRGLREAATFMLAPDDERVREIVATFTEEDIRKLIDRLKAGAPAEEIVQEVMASASVSGWPSQKR